MSEAASAGTPLRSICRGFSRRGLRNAQTVCVHKIKDLTEVPEQFARKDQCQKRPTRFRKFRVAQPASIPVYQPGTSTQARDRNFLTPKDSWIFKKPDHFDRVAKIWDRIIVSMAAFTSKLPIQQVVRLNRVVNVLKELSFTTNFEDSSVFQKKVKDQLDQIRYDIVCDIDPVSLKKRQARFRNSDLHNSLRRAIHASKAQMLQFSKIGRALEKGSKLKVQQSIDQHYKDLTTKVETPQEFLDDLDVFLGNFLPNFFVDRRNRKLKEAKYFPSVSSSACLEKSRADGGKLSCLIDKFKETPIDRSAVTMSDKYSERVPMVNVGKLWKAQKQACAAPQVEKAHVVSLSIMGNKCRTVTKSPAHIVSTGAIVQRHWMTNFIKRWHCTRNVMTNNAFKEVFSKWQVPVQSLDSEFYLSSDLTAATDRIPHDLIQVVCKRMKEFTVGSTAAHTKTYRDAIDKSFANSILCYNKVTDVNDGNPVEVPQQTGCLMGQSLSWILLNLYHAWLINYATREAKTTSLKISYRRRAQVWGDDLIARWPRQIIDRYHAMLLATNGKFSQGKHFVSSKYIVFCEQIFSESKKRIPILRDLHMLPMRGLFDPEFPLRSVPDILAECEVKVRRKLSVQSVLFNSRHIQELYGTVATFTPRVFGGIGILPPKARSQILPVGARQVIRTLINDRIQRSRIHQIFRMPDKFAIERAKQIACPFEKTQDFIRISKGVAERLPSERFVDIGSEEKFEEFLRAADFRVSLQEKSIATIDPDRISMGRRVHAWLKAFYKVYKSPKPVTGKVTDFLKLQEADRRVVIDLATCNPESVYRHNLRVDDSRPDKVANIRQVANIRCWIFPMNEPDCYVTYIDNQQQRIGEPVGSHSVRRAVRLAKRGTTRNRNRNRGLKSQRSEESSDSDDNESFVPVPLSTIQTLARRDAEAQRLTIAQQELHSTYVRISQRFRKSHTKLSYDLMAGTFNQRQVDTLTMINEVHQDQSFRSRIKKPTQFEQPPDCVKDDLVDQQFSLALRLQQRIRNRQEKTFDDHVDRIQTEAKLVQGDNSGNILKW